MACCPGKSRSVIYRSIPFHENRLRTVLTTGRRSDAVHRLRTVFLTGRRGDNNWEDDSIGTYVDNTFDLLPAQQQQREVFFGCGQSGDNNSRPPPAHRAHSGHVSRVHCNCDTPGGSHPRTPLDVDFPSHPKSALSLPAHDISNSVNINDNQ